MAKVITFSRTFPAYHPKVGQQTYFLEKFLKGRPTTIEKTEWNPEKSLIEQLPIALDIWAELTPKYHTIRAGSRWKKGEYFSPRVWSGKPYNTPQIILAPDTLITDVYDFEIKTAYKELPLDYNTDVIINHRFYHTDNAIMKTVAKNDGLSLAELLQWFKYPKPFKGQIICWNENVTY
jgi:hypothetical protein